MATALEPFLLARVEIGVKEERKLGMGGSHLKT
jgi:hypothetical protein